MAEFIFQENGPLGLAIKDVDWQVAPGSDIKIPAVVANRGEDEIFVEITVKGLPLGWIAIDNPVIRLSSEEKQEITLTISPPPFPQSRAGDYQMIIHAFIQNKPEIAVTLQDTLTIAAYRSEGRIGIIMASTQYSVAPGGDIVIPVGLMNRGLDTDTFRLNIQGIPSEWISTTTPSVKLSPSEKRELEFKIAIPKTSRIIAGRNSFTIQISSEKYHDQISEVACIITVAVFTKFTTAILAPTLNANQTGTISIKNEGNAKEVYSIGFQNQANKLIFEKVVKVPVEKSGADQTATPQFRIEFIEAKAEEQVQVDAGETAVFEFRSRLRSREIIGGKTNYPFLAHIQSVASKQKNTLEGQIITKALFPQWALILVILLILACCLATFLFQRNNQKTVSITQTASAIQTQAVINGGEDTDADGLINSDEIQRGTDPQKADTDGDELKDGEEVLAFLTDPLKPDSDSDGLLDGEEILRQKTNPILPDTDGDTLIDGDEVKLKTNPLQPDTDTDGLNDGDETRLGTDPNKPDSDNDGLLDGQENQTCPNQLDPDSDKDGIVDGKDPDPCNQANPSVPTATAEVPTDTTPTDATATPEPPHLNGVIVFESNRDGNSEIYGMDLANGVQTRLTNSAAVDMQASLSPNSQQVVYVSNRDGNNEIYLGGLNNQAPVNLSNNPADEQFPAWSSDGNWIAFTTNRDGNNEIYVMKKDGSEARNLTMNPANDSDPTWFSGAGVLGADEWIAFTTDRDGNNEIYRMRIDGTEISNLSQNGANDHSPAGYGSSITFVSERDGNPEIYIMKLDGKSQTNVTNNPGQDIDPAYSSNNWIAFASDRDGYLDIYVIQTNGAGAYNLTKTPAQDRRPSWR